MSHEGKMKKRPPPRPRRVSSAKPDTINPPSNDFDGCKSDSELNNPYSIDFAITSKSMGSSPSIPKESTSGTFRQLDSDLLTLSHAPVHNENDDLSSVKSIESRTDSDMPNRTPMKAIHFTNSTFKDLIKSTTIRRDSSKLHQSDSPDFVFTPATTVMTASEQKTAITYGTLRKSSNSGSVSELFNKSKMKVRKSLRNWRFHGKAKSSEDDEMHDFMVRRPELYDVPLTKPDDFLDDNLEWMSMSHDSAMLRRRKAPKRDVIPVKSPKVKQVEETQPSCDSTLFEPVNDKKRSYSEGRIEIYRNMEFASRRRSPNLGLSKESPPFQSAINSSELFLLNDRHSASNPSLRDTMRNPCFESTRDSCDSPEMPDDTVFSEPSVKSLTVMKQTVVGPPKSNFLTLPAQNDSCNTDSLLIRKMAGSPKISRNRSVTSQPSHILNGVECESVTFHSPFSTKRTPEFLSVTDILSQEYSAIKNAESGRRPSFAESATEMNSFDESSGSFSESQDFVTSDGEEYEETVPSAGAIRKAGWLSLKPLLVVKRGRLEKASRRKWQKFWVNLKGGQLLFFELNEISNSEETSKQVLVLSVQGAIVQAMPEHATKSNVICLGTCNGNVYLLQALSQTEVRNWIYGLHMEAAALLARHRCQGQSSMTKQFIHDVLREDLDKMKTEIIEDEKMLKMAELQDSLVSDQKSHRTIIDQITKWQRNAERNQVHSFRLRCYLASLEGAEQPNPQEAIAAARKSSKQILSALKCFNVATLHSLVILKEPRKRSMTLKRTGDGSQSDRTVLPKQKKNIFHSLRGFESWKSSAKKRTPITGLISAFTPSSSSHSSTDRLKTPSSGHAPDTQSDDSLAGSLDSLLLSPFDLPSSSVRVAVANNDFVTVTLTANMTSRQLLEVVCQRKQLDSNSYFLAVGETAIRGDGRASEVEGRSVRIKKKREYEIELESRFADYGMLWKRPKALCCPLELAGVVAGGVAEACGVREGEEIVAINGELTLDMTDADVERAIANDRLRMLVQTTQFQPDCAHKTWWLDEGKMAAMDECVKEIVVPPPPVVSNVQPCFIRSPFSVVPSKPRKRDSVEDILNHLVVPPPPPTDFDAAEKATYDDMEGDQLISELLRKAEAVTKSLPAQQMTDFEKTWKVLEELVETETNYVADLDALLHRFLEPLHAEGFLSGTELLLSVRNIVEFQRTFLARLSQSFSSNRSDDAEVLNQSLLSVSSTFVRHAAHFKLYAEFCSCHAVAQELIEQTKSASSAVGAFLDARNPKQQHSLSLDSLLIKPVQRVLKYPLLLRQLLSLGESLPAATGLKSSLQAMQAVARHINDSQSVHDEFGMRGFHEIMEQAALMALGSVQIAASLTLSNLLCFCETEWRNAPDRKKGGGLEMLVFVFRSSVVLLCRPQRKKATATTDFVFTDVIPASHVDVKGDGPDGIDLTSTDAEYSLLCSSSEAKLRLVKSVRFIGRPKSVNRRSGLFITANPKRLSGGLLRHRRADDDGSSASSGDVTPLDS